uniref:Uncharacterized protein n=1 Tax=Arundo donax TaxID=35708 RepID=A0A0A9CY77_ARUDO
MLLWRGAGVFSSNWPQSLHCLNPWMQLISLLHYPTGFYFTLICNLMSFLSHPLTGLLNSKALT